MNINLKDEKFWAITLGVIAVFALTIKLLFNWFDVFDFLDALVNFAQVGVAVIVFIVALSIKKKSEGFIDVGRHALEMLQIKYPDNLMGPRYNRDNYDPEKGQGLEYLFITNVNPKSKQRAKFIPIQPLNEGILAIYIQKGTLVYGLNYLTEQATPEEIKKIQEDVFNSVSTILQKKYNKEKDYETLDNKGESAIIIDFREQEIGKKKFSNAVTECTEIALLTIKKYKK